MIVRTRLLIYIVLFKKMKIISTDLNSCSAIVTLKLFYCVIKNFDFFFSFLRFQIDKRMSYYMDEIRFKHMKDILRLVSACSYLLLLYNESPIRLTDVLIRKYVIGMIRSAIQSLVMRSKLGI